MPIAIDLPTQQSTTSKSTMTSSSNSSPTSSSKPDWQSIAQAKQAARDALIPDAWLIPPTDALNVIDVPATCGVLSPAEIVITEMAAPEVVRKMIEGELKSYDVTLAFCKRAAVAQQLTNCLTEILFEAALKTASAIDTEFARTGTPAGPLHGLPISLKDNFYIEGVDTTVGFVGWANDPATKAQESALALTLRESGAVLFCKTNVPTAMMIAESYNNCWGYTTNPYNRALSSGGSSGGEGALLALKGAPIGVGTDIGGSIRIPASFCGLYGLKPSFGRFTTYGTRSGLPGQEAVRSINGPMSASLDAVEMWTKTVIGTQGWTTDPSVVPIPWRDVVLPKQLCFGLIMDNGMVKPTPPVRRALLLTKAALEAAGHRVVEWSSYEPAQSADIIDRFFTGDGGLKIHQLLALSGEPYPLGLQRYGEAYEASKSTPPLVGALWDIQKDRATFAKNALSAWMASSSVTGTGRPFDGVISPTTAYSACPIHTFEHVTYTSTWNITDQSVCTFPVTAVDVTKDGKEAEFEARNEVEKRIWDRYDPEEVRGAPVALQMIAQRLEEEKVLALTRVAAEALKAASAQ